MDAAKRKPKAIEGFICPDCKFPVVFQTAQLLQSHYDYFHSPDAKIPEDSTSSMTQRHVFEEVSVAKPQSCKICNELCWHNISSCTKCKYTCHRKCQENAQSTKCPGFKQNSNAIVKSIRKVVTGSKVRYVDENVDLDLTYITKTIIAMSFPASGLEATYRNSINDVAGMLKLKHGNHYMVFNVSEKSYDISKLDHQVLEFGWPDHYAPPLDRLLTICKSMDSWLQMDRKNVVVVHCKGGKGRTGCVIAAFFLYRRVFVRPEDAMQFFALKRFSDAEENEETGITQPSQRRYVHYFGEVMEERLEIEDRSVLLQSILIQGVPNADTKFGCKPVIEIYKNLTELVFRSEETRLYTDKDECIEIPIGKSYGLVLVGDVLVKIYHKSDKLIARFQFHTCALNSNIITFGKKDLDVAYNKVEFTNYATVQLIFSEQLTTIAEKEKESTGLAPVVTLPPAPAPVEAVSPFGAPVSQPPAPVVTSQAPPSVAPAADLISFDTEPAPAPAPAPAPLNNPFIDPIPSIAVVDAAKADAQREHEHEHEHNPDAFDASFSQHDAMKQQQQPVPPKRHKKTKAKVALDQPMLYLNDGPHHHHPHPSKSTEESSESSDDEPVATGQLYEFSAVGSPRVMQTGPKTAYVPPEDETATASDFLQNIHESQPWFFDRMSQPAAERLLKEKARMGEYVVRRESPVSYVLVVLCPDSVRSFNIAFNPVKRDFTISNTIAKTSTFVSIVTLVTFFKYNPICEVVSIPLRLSTGFGVGGILNRTQTVSGGTVGVARAASVSVSSSGSANSSSTLRAGYGGAAGTDEYISEMLRYASVMPASVPAPAPSTTEKQ